LCPEIEHCLIKSGYLLAREKLEGNRAGFFHGERTILDSACENPTDVGVEHGDSRRERERRHGRRGVVAHAGKSAK
jgi:hypothetical protein